MRKRELEADIAHHWQQISPLLWRFYLRPGIHFHHGRELEMEDVIASLTRINTLPLYSHITKIDSLPRGRWIFIFPSRIAGCRGCWAGPGDDFAAGVGNAG